MPTQIVGGRPYNVGTPEWQQAMQLDRVTQAGTGGTAAGQALSNEINTALPALEGLDRAIVGSQSGFGGAKVGGIPGVSDNISQNPQNTIQLSNVDRTAANAAEFGAAKDKVGQETSGALTGLRSALAGRGLLGSGAESRGTTGIIQKGQQELGDTTRQQAVTDADLTQQNAVANLNAGVAQRGQDITQRGQDIQREDNIMRAQQAQAELAYQQRQTVLQGLMSALSGGIRSY